MPNEEAKLELCRILNKTGALKFGAFKLTSGKFSPYYIDLRLVPSFPDAFQGICQLYMRFVEREITPESFQRIAGIPVAGIPYAALIAYSLNKPFLYTRKGVKLHGRQKRIEGILAPGDKILIVDDLITTGLSLRRTARTVTSEGGIVEDVAVLIDRQEGGKERLEKLGIRLHAVLTITDIADAMRGLELIDEQQRKTILKQIREK